MDKDMPTPKEQSAFEHWYRSVPSDVAIKSTSHYTACRNAWNAALEHAAKVCEDRFSENAWNEFHAARYCAIAIRREREEPPLDLEQAQKLVRDARLARGDVGAFTFDLPKGDQG